MKQMKNYLFLFIALLGILFSGCEKDLDDLTPVRQENKYKVRNVTLKMIPQIEEELDSVKEFLKTKSIQNRTIYDFNLNEEQIKELQLANGDVNYSFIVEKQLDENIPYYFENLEITLKDSGYDAYVLKWIPADGNVFGGLDKFTGELQYQDLDGRILQSVQMFEGLLTQSKQITQTVGCIHYVIHIDTEGNGTIMSSYDDCGGGGSGGPNTGTISGINSIENGGFSGTNSNNNSQPHSSNGQYYYLTYNGPSYGPIIPTTDEVERVKCQAFLNSLSTSQYNFLGSNQDVSNQIFSYLIENWFTSNSKNFMKELIDLCMNNPTLTLDDILNNKIKNEPTGDLDNNIEGDFDNTTYSDFNPQQTWSNIPSVIPIGNFVGWNRLAHPNWQCMEYSKEQLRVMGYKISNYSSTGQTFQIYTAQNGVNNTALANGLSYLKYALSNGIPVIVGIDNHSGSPNPGTDNTTDHFIVIVGMGTDATGKYFQFYDNASGDPLQGTSISNKLYYNSTTGIISGSSMTNYAIDNNLNPYKLTMIRKSKLL